MNTRFLILCKSLAKNGVLDIQVNSANHNEAYIPKSGKNYVTRILCGVFTTRSYNFHVRSQYNQGGHNNTERGEDVKHALHCYASHCNAIKSWNFFKELLLTSFIWFCHLKAFHNKWHRSYLIMICKACAWILKLFLQPLSSECACKVLYQYAGR